MTACKDCKLWMKLKSVGCFDSVGCCREVLGCIQRHYIKIDLHRILQQQKCCTSNKNCQKVTKSSINNKRSSSLIWKLMTQLMHLMGNKTDNGSELISIIYYKLLYCWKGLALCNVWPYREDPTNQGRALGGNSSKWIDDVFIEIKRT